MKLVNRLYNALDVFLMLWPAVFGGHVIRDISWRGRFAYCGMGVYFGDRILITGFSNIRIGGGTAFMSGSYIYGHESSNLVIGTNCSFNHNVFLGASAGEIIIGNDVLIGPNVVLRSADHLFESTEVPIRCQGHRSGRIVIGDDVWIASNVVITSNVTIGSGCVVGAGSVVTRDLPPMSICAGNPARPIRSRLI